MPTQQTIGFPSSSDYLPAEEEEDKTELINFLIFVILYRLPFLEMEFGDYVS